MDEQNLISKLIKDIKLLFQSLGKFGNIDSENLNIDLFLLIQKLSSIADNFKSLLPEEIALKELTYDSAIEYFVNNRPPGNIKGAILRKIEDRGQIIIQVFLDKKNKLVCMPNGKPYGRKMLVQELDSDLSEAFDDEDLIIVE